MWRREVNTFACGAISKWSHIGAVRERDSDSDSDSDQVYVEQPVTSGAGSDERGRIRR